MALDAWLPIGFTLPDGAFGLSRFGELPLAAVSCNGDQLLWPVGEVRSPGNKAEALAFALALKAAPVSDVLGSSEGGQGWRL